MPTIEMPHVMTVQGPVDPSTLGFILPHEHTQCTLWHIQDRWDYWELTPDEPVILQELAWFKEAGGTALADLTLPGIGRDPAWLLRISELSRLPIVMGGGWYRTAYYPPEALIEKRSVDSLAEELVHDATVGVGDTGHPDRDPGRDRDGQAVGHAGRGAGLPRGGALLAADRLAISTHAVLSDVGAAQLTILEEEGVDPGRVVIGHADSYPVLDHYLSLINRGRVGRVRLPGHVLHADGEVRRGEGHRPAAGAAPPGARRPRPAQPRRLPQQPAAPLRGQRVHVPVRRRSCRGSASGACPRRRSSS